MWVVRFYHGFTDELTSQHPLPHDEQELTDLLGWWPPYGASRLNAREVKLLLPPGASYNEFHSAYLECEA